MEAARDADDDGTSADATIRCLARSPPTAMSAPVTSLTMLGILVSVLGLFVAGNVQLLAIGLVTILAAGILEVVGQPDGQVA